MKSLVVWRVSEGTGLDPRLEFTVRPELECAEAAGVDRQILAAAGS